MIILDSFAVIALFRDEPAASQVRALIGGTQGVALSVLGVSEVLDHLVRVFGADEDDAVLDLAQLGLQPALGVDDTVAMHAGLLRARHYHRTTRAVSLADCVAATLARWRKARLATADPDLLELCREEGIDVQALPDSSGRTWSPIS